MNLFTYLKTINAIALITVTLGAYADQQPNFGTLKDPVAATSATGNGYVTHINPGTNRPIVAVAKADKTANTDFLLYDITSSGYINYRPGTHDYQTPSAEKLHFAIDSYGPNENDYNIYLGYIDTQKNQAKPMIEKGICSSQNGNACVFTAFTQLTQFPDVDSIDIAVDDGKLYLAYREKVSKAINLWEYSPTTTIWTPISSGIVQDTAAYDIGNNKRANFKLRMINHVPYLATTRELFKLNNGSWQYIADFTKSNDELIAMEPCSGSYICLAEVNTNDNSKIEFYKIYTGDVNRVSHAEYTFTGGNFNKINLIANDNYAYMTLSGSYQEDDGGHHSGVILAAKRPLTLTTQKEMNGSFLYQLDLNSSDTVMNYMGTIDAQNSNMTTIQANPNSGLNHQAYMFGSNGLVHTIDNLALN